MSMNRQLRRAQDKQEKKVEREKADRKAERQRRVDQLRAQRQKRRQDTLAKAQAGKKDAGSKESGGNVAEGKASGAAAQPARAGRNDPGRFSGALAIATIVFIMMQAVLPTEPDATFDSVIKAGFYLMLGYFLSLWLFRRGQPNAMLLSALAGIILLTGTWLGFLLRPDSAMDGLAMLLSLPLLALGIFLARFVYKLARSQNPA